jgi:hypothetical protein
MAFTDSEINSETKNPFRRFDRTFWTGYRRIERPLCLHSTPQREKENPDVHPYLEQDSNPRSQCSRPYTP